MITEPTVAPSPATTSASPTTSRYHGECDDVVTVVETAGFGSSNAVICFGAGGGSTGSTGFVSTGVSTGGGSGVGGGAGSTFSAAAFSSSRFLHASIACWTTACFDRSFVAVLNFS